MSKSVMSEISVPSTDHFTACIYVKRSEEADTMRKIHQMTMALSQHGILLSVGPNRRQGIKNFITCTLSVSIDHEVTSRGAGRHVSVSEFTLEDVESMLSNGETPKKIADRIGISLATYYRHMKKAKEIRDAGRNASNIHF